MALYKCVTCGRLISPEAEVCPGCGKPNAGEAAEKKARYDEKWAEGEARRQAEYEAQRREEGRKREQELRPLRIQDTLIGWGSFLLAVPVLYYFGAQNLFWFVINYAFILFVVWFVFLLVSPSDPEALSGGRRFAAGLWILVIISILVF